MRTAGLAAVAAARADGSWWALDAVEDLLEPPDLAAALDASADARASWDGFPRSTRRAILEWIGTGKDRRDPRQAGPADRRRSRGRTPGEPMAPTVGRDQALGVTMRRRGSAAAGRRSRPAPDAGLLEPSLPGGATAKVTRDVWNHPAMATPVDQPPTYLDCRPPA